MEKRAFGPDGFPLPVIGQGTWEMENDRKRSIAALRLGIDLGMTHIDTAEMYGNGAVEEIVGEAIAGRRDEVFLASKVLPANASREGTIAACERSLKRLKTDTLDLYLLHWPGRHPLEETIAAFETLRRDGKIRRYGVSNFNTSEVERACRIAGKSRIACNQVLYHLEERSIEHSLIPKCVELGVAVVAYSPFAQGKFPPAKAKAVQALSAAARRLNATPRQVALAFLVRRSSVFAVPKSSNTKHVRENAAAGDLLLSAEDVRTIESAFPLGKPKKNLPML